MTSVLEVYMGDHSAGTLARPRGGRLTFTYSDTYRGRGDATPLSVSMPLDNPTYTNAVVDPWLWGLLPDNSAVLDRWARTFQVSASSAFGLLSTPVGEDCAGAVRFVRPERLADGALELPGDVEWLDTAAIARRLRDLRSDTTSWLGSDTTGHFSLAGAQAKTALLLREGRWGVPSGRAATSHILKPAIAGRSDHDLNEHLCLGAARRTGLPVASSSVMRFEAEQAIVVERYDRVGSATEDDLVRVHQEDLCQALSIHPRAKYQAGGGPKPADIAGLLRRTITLDRAEADLARFTDALIFNWLIGGTDAHAKNYSMLLSGSRVRLAPLYDIGSALPYPDLHVRKLRLAMKFGGDYSLLPRGREVWAKVGAEVGLPPTIVVERARALVETVPDAFADAAADPAVKELGSDMPARLVDAVAERVRSCATALP